MVTCVLIVLCLFVILVTSRFDFEGRSWVLIAPVPGLRIPYLFLSSMAKIETDQQQLGRN